MNWLKRVPLTISGTISFIAIIIPAWLHEPMHIGMSKALGGEIKKITYLDEKSRKNDEWMQYRPVPDFFLSKVPVTVETENGLVRCILVSLAPLILLPIGLHSLIYVDSPSILNVFVGVFFTAAGFPSMPDLVGAKKAFDASVEMHGHEEVLAWK